MIFSQRIEAIGDNVPIFSTDGKTAMRIDTLSSYVSAISSEMVEAKEAHAFQLRDFRRTAETMLASIGISSDVRAQLQSHGLGGVQHRHYDRHDYMQEKRRAVELWTRYLDRLKSGKKTTNVVLIHHRSR